ncbi:MAG: 2-polyprenyl-3-methyl-6-methoxy-1,4-benzoquinone monooxygenase [Burkholderiaceae bacterium]
MSPIDRLIVAADNGLRTLSGAGHAARPRPQVPPDTAAEPVQPLSDAERRAAGAFMRVNHVGEVCAQALYTAQALGTTDPVLRARFEQAAREETDHLAWTRDRLAELGARASLLNPLWYAGAFDIGWLAARAGDAASLGFVIETERQVEAHLQSHTERLPANDRASRVIVEQMKTDEAAHGQAARAAGGVELVAPLRWAMRAAARVMTTTAHYL